MSELGMGGALLPKVGVEKLFARGRDLLMAGQDPPRGVARPEPGGYRIEGHWGYASGIYPPV